jgi:hypothetical protein
MRRAKNAGMETVLRAVRPEGGAEGGGCGGRDALGENGKSGRVKRANGK